MDVGAFFQGIWESKWGNHITLVAVTWIVVFILSRVNGHFFNIIDQRLTGFGVPERRLAKLDSLVDFLLVIIGVFVTLFILGVGEALWGAVAVTSVAGIIIGLAAQQLAQNLLAGMVILFERPFTVGDYVEIDGRQGTVKKVTLHATGLLDPNGLVILVPNSRVLGSAVTNFSANPERRLSVTIDVRDNGALDEVRAVLLQAVRGEEHLRRPEATRVYVKESLDDGDRFEIQYWVARTEFFGHCQPSAQARLLKALAKAGFSTAVPTRRNLNLTEATAGGGPGA